VAATGVAGLAGTTGIPKLLAYAGRHAAAANALPSSVPTTDCLFIIATPMNGLWIHLLLKAKS
jgi:hypothetical protein